ncbi:site-2 protease family protein [Methanothrix soehngenii]|jgi:Zn-dependent protease/CBS domain-containing protein|uniref:site-2 protease family protein n=2 Tax=Methanothrix soehngenii TaxID=2223 RepID=UPI0023F19273|nr:site-2 protease family protein [Methanothrix soehngenii]MDD5256529.1 site-2 protease family protein [Methanothrix soehngenii]MDD5733840.1 site-2 protease family protein [Methanothrix soehngenii]
MMNSSLQLGKIMGIPVQLHWSFLLVILYIAWAFASFSQQVLGRSYGFGEIEPAGLRWAYSLIFSLVLFTCVALHELGHSYIALKNGIAIRSITLYFFGGVSAMEEIPRNPRLELQMAFAGPAVSGILGLMGILLATLLDEGSPLGIMLWMLGLLNIILMLFNLLPAFPMDGGRLLRAWFATQMPYIKATQRAASIGKLFAIIMFVLGLFSFNFILLFVAFFVYVGASEEEKATQISVSLEGTRVMDIMSDDVHTVDPDMTLQDLKEHMFEEKHRGYPVVSGDEVIGVVTLSDLQRIPQVDHADTRVSEVMTRKLYVIGPSEEASAAMMMMNKMNIRRLPVMSDGRLVGIVSREDLVRAIELCSGQD